MKVMDLHLRTHRVGKRGTNQCGPEMLGGPLTVEKPVHGEGAYVQPSQSHFHCRKKHRSSHHHHHHHHHHRHRHDPDHDC